MRANKDTFSWKQISKGFWLAVRLTLVFGMLFYLINGDFTLYSLLVTMGMSAMYTFVLGFGQGLLNDYLSTKWDWITETNKRVWIGVLGTLIYTIPIILLIDYFLFIKIKGFDSVDFFKPPMIWIHLFWVQFSLGVSAFLHARGFMMEWKNAVSHETTQHKIVAKTETAKFETLKNQIDPHFLFNSLNVLTSLIGENPNQAEKFTTKLSKIYRYVLEQRNKELVPIQEELLFAKNYMELLQMRFEDAIQFTLPKGTEDSALKLVPLSLQLLLENAVKHNVVSSKKPLEISIFIKNGFLYIQNNINPKDAIGKGTKIGLRNIADRYGLITEKNIEIINNHRTFTVKLPLLLNTESMKINSNNLEKNSYVRAVEKVEKLKEFYQNLVSYCLVIPFLVYINYQFSPQFKWFWFPAIGWGIGLLFHFLEVHNYNFILGKNWEERKIKELMKEESEYKN